MRYNICMGLIKDKCMIEHCDKKVEGLFKPCDNHIKYAKHRGLIGAKEPCATVDCKWFKVYDSNGLCTNCMARHRRKVRGQEYLDKDKAFKKRWISNPANRERSNANHRKSYRKAVEFGNYRARKQEYYKGRGKAGYNHRTALRRARKLQQTPPWADLQDLKLIYKNCPEGHEVDHIIPLAGKEVCGLHVSYNLQYLPVLENRSKGNKIV